MGGHSTLLAVTPDYLAGKFPLGTEVVEFLVEVYAKWRITGNARWSHDVLERMPKFQIITLKWSGGKNALLPCQSPYLYPNGTYVLSAKRRLLKKVILYNLYSGLVIF